MKKDSLQFRILEEELQPYKTFLAKAADTVLEQEVSNYPIFIAHQQEFDVGIPLVNQEQTEGNWSINLSTLEEFSTKNIILPEKVEEFQNVYKDPLENLCLFVLSELGATFIFLPR